MAPKSQMTYQPALCQLLRFGCLSLKHPLAESGYGCHLSTTRDAREFRLWNVSRHQIPLEAGPTAPLFGLVFQTRLWQFTTTAVQLLATTQERLLLDQAGRLRSPVQKSHL